MRKRKPFGAPSTVFSVPAIHVRGAVGAYKDSGDLASEIARRQELPEQFSFCQREQKVRRYRAKEANPLMCPDCEHEAASQAAALDAGGVRAGNMPEGWGRTA